METEKKRPMRELEIEARLRVIGTYFDLEDLVNSKKDNQAVEKYYRKSDFFYWWIHNHGGDSIHLGLSEDDFFHKDDFLNQARFVGTLLTRPSMQILELGAGRLINTKYLANQFPQHQFTALDLPNRNFLKNRVPGNVTLREGDYNDLSAFPEASFDVVFAVETICYAESKERVIAQIARVLKPGGKLVIFDGYYAQDPAQMSELERRAAAVTYAAMCVTASDQYIGNTKKYLEQHGFSPIEITDVSFKIRPNLRRLDRISCYFFTHPRLIRFARRHLPIEATLNAIAGWLMLYVTDGEHIYQYDRVVAEKKA